MNRDLACFARLGLLCLGMMLGCAFNPAVSGPPAGNPDGTCEVSAPLQAEDTSRPDHVVGTGTPESCTPSAVHEAVKKGGVITFDCGPEPIAIDINYLIALPTEAGPRIVIDGGGKVALSAGSYHVLDLTRCRRIDGGWVPPWECEKLPLQRLTVQNLTFFDSGTLASGSGGGGAISVFDSELKIVNCRFFNNRCTLENGSGGCGGAIYARGYSQDTAVWIVNSTFGGAPGLGNVSTNGGALAGADASFFIVNSLFTDNVAEDERSAGTQQLRGHGSGGAIFAEIYEKDASIDLCGVRISNNRASDVGGALYFESYRDHRGVLSIHDSVVLNNPSRSDLGRYSGIFTTNGIFVWIW